MAIFELVQDIIETNLLTKFHEDPTINVASEALQYLKNLLTTFHEDMTINMTFRVKNGPAPDIIRINVLTKFHNDRTINMTSRVITRKNAPLPGGHMNLLIKFHDNSTMNVASRVLTRFFYSNITIFELIQDIIENNLLTKVHEAWTINVSSRVLKRQMLTPHNTRQTKGDHKCSP
ncbi:hypothetical protein DPMN_000101 [Dreissena polymorpha]|uniref:Uncharacterized protein n=1 Tax=Dreissena polymorpha TaxID=45954 RepID=A0A9D4MGQ4_DREPO|nr:hypothetical protein DPMN_000101 [Dreissena polymorpha]